MFSGLFDRIHDDAYMCTRTSPATVEEFVEFGLTPADYLHYVALMLRLQGELILESISESTAEELMNFCIKKNLVEKDALYSNPSHMLGLLHRRDAEYYHGWLRYPKTPEEFRLCVERKLSARWDEESAYLYDNFGNIDFVYDDKNKISDSVEVVDIDSPVRIVRLNLGTCKAEILTRGEVSEIYKLAKRKKDELESKMAKHLAMLPEGESIDAIAKGYPWIKELFALCEQETLFDDIYEKIEKAYSTPDLHKLNESEGITVICDEDSCSKNNHFIFNVRVNLSFYNLPDKIISLRRCADCRKYQILLADFIELTNSYGIPRCHIIYANDRCGDFSRFEVTSIFYDMGYTVSQSVGLSAAKRQAILKCAIDKGKASKSEVLSFLRQRMNINGMKSGNEQAFEKWKADYNYIKQL